VIKTVREATFRPPLFRVSTQINYQVPDGASPGPALVEVTRGDGHVSTGYLTITSVAPAIFTLNHNGSGSAARWTVLPLLGLPLQQHGQTGNQTSSPCLELASGQMRLMSPSVSM
jgi:uncharacterized protein (TIGR03437 family)